MTRPDIARTLWRLFEILSAIFVITSLLVVVYSDYPILRAIAGLALIALVSAVTATIVHRYEHRPME